MNGRSSPNLLVFVVIGLLAVVVASLGFAYYVVFGAAQFQSLPGNVYKVSLQEYDIIATPEPIVARVGEPIIVQISNDGSVGHEFMIVADMNMMVMHLRQLMEEIMEENPEADEEEIIHEVEEAHDAMLDMMIEPIRDDFEGPVQVKLAPGESETVTYVFYEPGVYTVVCLELEGSFPVFHGELGMFTQIIVVE